MKESGDGEHFPCKRRRHGRFCFTIHASNPLTIIEKALKLTTDCKLIFRFPKSDPSLRDRTLPILEEKVGTSRIQRRTKSLTVVPEVIIDRSVIITRMMMLCPHLW